MACDFQQCGILTCVDSDKPVQPPFKLRNSRWCSVSRLEIIEYSRDRLQADLRICLSHIPHCLKSHALAQLFKYKACLLIFVEALDFSNIP